VTIKEPRDSRLYSLLPLWHRNTKKAKKRGEMLLHPSIELMPGGVGALVIITGSRINFILITITITIISRRSRSTSSPRRKTTMSIHGEVKVLDLLIGDGRHLPLRCSHRCQLGSRRRNCDIPSSHKLVLSPPGLLVQSKTLMCNIISVLAHLPHAREEASGTMLGAPRVAGASIMIMAFLGTTLSSGHHGGNIRTSGLLSGNLEGVHDDFFTKSVERSRNDVVDEPLNILSIVGSHAVQNCTL